LEISLLESDEDKMQLKRVAVCFALIFLVFQVFLFSRIQSPNDQPTTQPLLSLIGSTNKDKSSDPLDLSQFDEPQPGARELGHKEKEDKSKLSNASNRTIQVFVVPHSHCDAGWLKTFEQYYQDQVQHILTSVSHALQKQPNRKFSWVETSFLERWWRDQPSQERDPFRKLFETQQLEFLMGGWVSHDEATVTYIQAINQMTSGHHFLSKEFGSSAIPRIGWQIDPFGLSQVTASLFSNMCFDANVAWRVKGDQRRDFLEKKMLEFIWRGSSSLERSSDLLLHLLPWSYASPSEFLFESELPEKDVAAVTQLFVESVKIRAQAYASDQLMWPWGHDFSFTNASIMFSSMDKIFNFIHSHPEFGVRFFCIFFFIVVA
jgi:hypothetical protein